MKTVATLAAVSMLTLAGVAVAQTTPPAQPQTQAPQTQAAPQAQEQAPNARRDEPRRPRLSRADFEALTDARMAAIPAGLKLNPEQQRLWAPVEQALRAMSAQRADRFEERRQRMEQRRQGADRPVRDMAQRLEERAQNLTQAAQRLTALSDAVKPFWASLDENQKRILPVLMRQGGGREGRYAGMRHHHGHDRGGMEHGRR